MDSAVARVFVVPELVETILLCLDFKALFVVQRVGKAIQSIIQGSMMLRRKMYLCQGINVARKKVPSISAINPLIAKNGTLPLLPNAEFGDYVHHGAKGVGSLRTSVCGHISDTELDAVAALFASSGSGRPS